MASAHLPTTPLSPHTIKRRTDNAVAKRFNIRFKIDRMREQRRLEKSLAEVWDDSPLSDRRAASAYRRAPV